MGSGMGGAAKVGVEVEMMRREVEELRGRNRELSRQIGVVEEDNGRLKEEVRRVSMVREPARESNGYIEDRQR